MTPTEQFNDACVRFGLGKRLDIENYPDVPAFPVYEHAREIAHELIDSAKQHLSSLPNIHFDFIDASDVNAVVFKQNNRYFIGITAGAITMLHLVLDRILANHTTFPNIGEPSRERIDLPPVPWSIVDPERLFKLGIRPVVPVDERRQLYSKHLADQSLMFLLGHEIAHISRGHVDYWRITTGNAFFSELCWNGTSEQAIERQALEADADRRSIYARSNSMFMTAESTASEIPLWAESPASIEAFQYDWSFAVNVLFRLFGDKRFAGSDLDDRTYPPLPLRRRMAMDYASQLLLEHWGVENKDKISDAIDGSVKATEFSFLAIGAAPSEGGLADAFSEDANQHIKKLHDVWSKLIPKLLPYSHEKLM